MPAEVSTAAYKTSSAMAARKTSAYCRLSKDARRVAQAGTVEVAP